MGMMMKMMRRRRMTLGLVTHVFHKTMVTTTIIITRSKGL